MRRSLVVALSLCLCAPWLAACYSTSGTQSLAASIPANALVVLSLNWQAVKSDGDLMKLVKGEDFRKVFRQLSVDEETVSQIAVFGDRADGAAGSTAMLLGGSFDAEQVAATLKEHGWREESSDGREVYVDLDGTRLAALSSGALVCGTKKGVEGAMRAESDEAASFASTDAYKRLSKLFDTAEHPVSMVIAFPQQLQDAAGTALQISSAVMDFAGVGSLGKLMSKIGYSRAVGCSIGREGDAFPVELVAVMKDEDAAALVSGGLTLLKGIGTLAGQPPTRTPEEAEALRNFQNMSVSREGDVLSIGLVMSRKSLFPN